MGLCAFVWQSFESKQPKSDLDDVLQNPDQQQFKELTFRINTSAQFYTPHFTREGEQKYK